MLPQITYGLHLYSLSSPPVPLPPAPSLERLSPPRHSILMPLALFHIACYTLLLPSTYLLLTHQRNLRHIRRRAPTRGPAIPLLSILPQCTHHCRPTISPYTTYLQCMPCLVALPFSRLLGCLSQSFPTTFEDAIINRKSLQLPNSSIE
jgi:hypothetical protein